MATREERSTGRVEAGRKERIPVGVPRAKLAFPARPGYVNRVFNDTDGRLANALQGGYSFVESDKPMGATDIDNVNRDLGSRVSRVVDKTTGQKAYLMEIKQEYYAEDQAAKAAAVAAVDKQIKHGKLEDDPSRYIPDKGRGISIETR